MGGYDLEDLRRLACVLRGVGTLTLGEGGRLEPAVDTVEPVIKSS